MRHHLSNLGFGKLVLWESYFGGYQYHMNGCSEFPPNSDAGGALDGPQRNDTPTGNRVDSANTSSLPYTAGGMEGMNGMGCLVPVGHKDKRGRLQQQAFRVSLVQGVVGWSTQGVGKPAVQMSLDERKQTPLSPTTQ